jgi:hypothetical protein
MWANDIVSADRNQMRYALEPDFWLKGGVGIRWLK